MADLSGDALFSDGQRLTFIKPGVGATSFKAFITSFSDSWGLTWSSEGVFGRMDELHKFQRTVRSCNISWDLPATGIGDARSLQSKLSKLIMMLYPHYEGRLSSATSMTAPPFIRVKFGNLLRNSHNRKKGLLIKVDNFTHNLDLDPGMFTKGSGFYPKNSNLSISFDVIHEHPLGWRGGTGMARNGFERYPYGHSYKSTVKFDKAIDDFGQLVKDLSAEAVAEKSIGEDIDHIENIRQEDGVDRTEGSSGWSWLQDDDYKSAGSDSSEAQKVEDINDNAIGYMTETSEKAANWYKQ